MTFPLRAPAPLLAPASWLGSALCALLLLLHPGETAASRAAAGDATNGFGGEALVQGDPAGTNAPGEGPAGGEVGVASEAEDESGAQEAVPPGGDETAWWFWPLVLFLMTFVMGILAAVAGVGGGVLFVPIVSGFCPFHLDFVRCTGLLVALSGALAAGPGFLRMNLASLRLAMPVALIASTCAIAGAMVGLALPTNVVQTALGAAILGIVVLMLRARKSTFPDVPRADALSQALRIHGVYMEASLGQEVDWKIHRTVPGLILFLGIGFMAGMFGLGAGWANVPTLNLVLGAPLKVSVATSKFLLSITDTSAAWIYVNEGCVIPLMVVPSLVGIMLGSFVGVRVLKLARPGFVRWMVIGILIFAGGKALTKGLGLPFIV
ncbi:MAG: sulfite exporter TauE/SafE family protein [Gemmatimonadota bacterium]|jgi:uncharacterized membrane protein YfcA